VYGCARQGSGSSKRLFTNNFHLFLHYDRFKVGVFSGIAGGSKKPHYHKRDNGSVAIHPGHKGHYACRLSRFALLVVAAF
jgi:hypothetical protein